MCDIATLSNYVTSEVDIISSYIFLRLCLYYRESLLHFIIVYLLCNCIYIYVLNAQYSLLHIRAIADALFPDSFPISRISEFLRTTRR